MEEDRPSEEKERFMREALKQAELAIEANEVPVGCVFVHEGEIIGSGFNQTNAEFNATRHAEFVGVDHILLDADTPFDASVFPSTDLYVTCEPCIMCAAALSKLRIRKVYYGCSNDKFGGCGSILSLHKQHYDIEPGVLEDEAVSMFRRFYSRENDRAPEEKRKRKDDSGVAEEKGS